MARNDEEKLIKIGLDAVPVDPKEVDKMVAESIAILSAKIREMIGAAKQVEAGRDVEEVVRETGVAKHTIRIWQERLRGKGVAEGQERRVIGDETASRGVVGLCLPPDGEWAVC